MEHLDLMRKTRTSNNVEAELQRRFCLLCLHFMHSDFQQNGNLGIRSKAEFVLTVSGKPHIQDKARRWTTWGALYASLVESLGGGGILFFLPLTISRTTWEQYNYRTKPRHKDVIEHLSSLGISETALPFHHIADTVISLAIPPSTGVTAENVDE